MLSLDFICTQAITVCSSKGQALQLAYGLKFLSTQASRLWLGHPLRFKVKKKLVLFTLLVAGFVAAQSCKSLFKSEYAELEAAEMTAFVDAKYPEMTRRQIAQNEMVRKRFIDEYKKAFAFAQAAEEAGLHKTEEFKKILEFGVEQMLATKFIERNQEMVISKEEWEAYYTSHKDQFDAHLNFMATFSKEAVPDDVKEKYREPWSLTKLRGEKAREAGLDKESGFKLLVKFAKADILASLYARSIEEKNKLTDDEKKKYLAEHPSADPDKQKEKAQGLLERVKKGENFEKIATEFSDDPGSKGNGGDLGWSGKGRMDPVFEAAAFALQKGQTTGELVKSRFGYHIIRLEDRRMAQLKNDKAPAPEAHGQTFGRPQEPQVSKEEIHARHILIDTTEFEQFETQQVKDKVKRVLEDATLKYKVGAPEDFVVKVSGADNNQIPGGAPGAPMR
jgi:peptidyl-prolyl cis-trans isomerase C